MTTSVYVVIVHDTHSDPEVTVHEGFGEALNAYGKAVKESRYGEMHCQTDRLNIWKKTAQSMCGSLVVRLIPCSLTQETDCY